MPQSLSKIWVHIIFSTRKRERFLKDNQVRNRLYQYIIGICRELKCHTKIVNGVEDHVHILCSIPKDLSVSELIKKIKSASSKWIKSLENKDHLLDKFYWQRGYGVFSISQSAVPVVFSYIKNQTEHHKRISFQDEFREFLLKYKIQYDERYVWD